MAQVEQPPLRQTLYSCVHQTLTVRTNTIEENVALGERWWWKAPKCIWQGVNIELKDKQGECPSLFMPMGRRGNVIARKTTSFICLVLSESKHPLRHTGGEVKANSNVCVVLHCVVFVLFHCSAASRTGREYFCVSTLSHIISFSIPAEMTAVHMWASLWLGHVAHSTSFHVVLHLIASCSAFSGSIIPTDPCLGCEASQLWFQYSSPFSTFITEQKTHVSKPVWVSIWAWVYLKAQAGSLLKYVLT